MSRRRGAPARAAAVAVAMAAALAGARRGAAAAPDDGGGPGPDDAPAAPAAPAAPGDDGGAVPDDVPAAPGAPIAPGRSRPPPADLGAEIAILEREVAAHPDDVDLRLKLATRQLWADRRDDARRNALGVLARAPGYLDADLLLARLEGWDGQYDAARARVTRVLAAAPTRLDARLLQVDLALWARQASVARRLIAQLIVDGVGGAELLYRRAQLALLDHQPRRAYELASQVLELDPEHQGARAFRSSIQRFSIEAASEGEVYPDRFAARTALGETITVTLFPRATWSLTAAYEYRRRFGTDNHRVAIRGDWRARPDLALALYARAGAVEVVPRATILLDASWEPEGRWTAGGRYTYDRLPWDGDLHRVQASGGVALPWRLRLEAEVQGGVAASCGQVTGVWGARGRLWWTPRGWETSVSYGYGVEVDRAVVADPCVLPGAGIVDVDVHAVGVTLGHQLGPKLLARLGYGVERRPDDVWVHLASVTLRAWM